MTTAPTKPANPNEAKPTLGLGKLTAEAKAAPEAKVSLKAICSEIEIGPTCRSGKAPNCRSRGEEISRTSKGAQAPLGMGMVKGLAG